MSEPVAPVLVGPVQVVGCGLLGTSVGLALRRAGVEVWLSDINSEHVRTATGLGAGIPTPATGAPQLVVVAVPPDHISTAVQEALQTGAVVTDVGSVKGLPLTELIDVVDAETLRRYVGSHPMAGSERSGPLAASSALFDGRPWAVAAHEEAAPEAIELVEDLARACGATVIRLTPAEHDRAVARTSHLPHLMSVLTAGQLTDAQSDHLSLSGQGVRDVTRIAAGDPVLWSQIIRGNAAAVAELLVEVRSQVDDLIVALQGAGESELAAILGRGVAGTQAIPGKHGGPALATESLFVAVPDEPGNLARVFTDISEIGVNVEDLRIDHDPGRPVGLLEVVVRTDSVEHLRSSLEARSWVTHR